jgi:hypothetical protein
MVASAHFLTSWTLVTTSPHFLLLPYITRECARIVLAESGDPLSAGEIADRVKARGKDLGNQATANVTNALRRYVDKGHHFTREKVGGAHLYGLTEWKRRDPQGEGSAPGLEA